MADKLTSDYRRLLLADYSLSMLRRSIDLVRSFWKAHPGGNGAAPRARVPPESVLELPSAVVDALRAWQGDFPCTRRALSVPRDADAASKLAIPAICALSP